MRERYQSTGRSRGSFKTELPGHSLHPALAEIGCFEHERLGRSKQRLYEFAAHNDPAAASGAFDAIEKAWEVLEQFPFTCRRAEDADPFIRELVILFGASGYVALFEIENDEVVTVLAVRHQLEDDYQ